MRKEKARGCWEPRTLWSLSWGGGGPLRGGHTGTPPPSPQSIFIFFLVKYKPLKYNNVYTYPAWGYGIGWLMALSSMLCIPLWVFLKVWQTEGTLSEVSCAPWVWGLPGQE